MGNLLEDEAGSSTKYITQMNHIENIVSTHGGGDIKIGSWLQTGSITAAEIMAKAGHNWLALDCEHTSADIALVENMSRALRSYDLSFLVRVSEVNTIEIRKCLDVGAHGVIVPLVCNAKQASKAVQASKYQPLGNRGHCFGRMNEWGADFKSYSENGNSRTIVIIMIESKEGVENIEEILKVPGIDGIFVGPYDLSGSYGIPGDIDNQIMCEALDVIYNACKCANVPFGQHFINKSTEAVIEAVRAGNDIICVDADSIFLSRSANKFLDQFVQYNHG